MASNTNKRSRQELSDSDSDTEPRPDSWPHFLMIKGTDDTNSLKDMSPFAIQKGIKGIVGTDILNVKRLRSGDLLAEVSCEKHARILLKANTIGTIPVAITAHRSLNSSKGVVRCGALGNCDDAEIVRSLKNYNVTEARRIKVRRDGKLVETNTVILTFGVPELPKEVYFGYERCKVDLYIPNPLRCFKCQSYGHGKDRCQKEAVCARCGSSDHFDDKACNNPELCVHCKGPHPSYSRSCPKFKSEQEIVRIKYTQKVTFPEARKQVEARGPTYASVASRQLTSKHTLISTGTQTDLTWVESNKPIECLPVSKVSVSNASTCTSTPNASTCTSTPTSSTSDNHSSISVPTKTNSQTKKVNTPTKVITQTETKTIKHTDSCKVKPNIGAKPTNQYSQRPKKGSEDPVSLYNKYGELEDMDTDHPLENRPDQRLRSPVRPPPNHKK